MNDGDTPERAALRRTVAFYDRYAEQFREGTRDHDVTQNYRALLKAIEGDPPFRILDLGCGPGRDLRSFRDLGHDPVGLDASVALAAMARAHSGCPVLVQDFLALDLPSNEFHGIFANASLFHVPRADLPDVLARLHESLRPRGVLFSSNPRGRDEESFAAGRFGSFHSEETWRGLMRAAGFSEIRHYYRPPGQPRERQPWFASVWRKGGPA